MELSYFAIIIGAIFVNNVVLAQFLGICPFLGVSSKVETSMGMGAAVTFVMAIAAVVAWLIQAYVLVPLDIVYMQTIVFILVIAALVQMVEIMLKKLSPSLYQSREAHEGHGEDTGRDQCDRHPLECLRHVLEFEPLADAGEEHQRQGESQRRSHRISDALQEVELLLDHQDRHAQHGAVGGDQGQEDTQCLI